MKSYYFISYLFSTIDGGWGFGSTWVSRTSFWRPVLSLDMIEKELKQRDNKIKGAGVMFVRKTSKKEWLLNGGLK